MPIYGYACSNCGHTLDELQKISDEPLVDCRACKQPALKRQLSAPRFRLKGKGWYETDFKSDNQRNIAGDKAPDKKTGDSADKAGDKSGETTKAAKPAEPKTADKTVSKSSDKSSGKESAA